MNEIRRYPILPSTQRTALALARSGAPPGTTIMAERQDEGVGRLDHAWASPLGGLYLSRIGSDSAGPVELLPMAIALELAGWMERALGVRAGIRWPNDLWLSDPDAKVGGVLADRIHTSWGYRVVVGIGVNVATDRRDFPAELAPSVAILRERTSRSVTVQDAEREALRAIPAATARVASPSGPAAIVGELAERLDGVGRSAELDGSPIGRIVGIDASGGLVAEQGGVRHIHATGTLRFMDRAAGGNDGGSRARAARR